MGQRRRGRVPIGFPISFEGHLLDGHGVEIIAMNAEHQKRLRSLIRFL